MNKMLVGLASFALLGGSAHAFDFVSVDSIKIMQESVEGTEIAKEFKSKIEKFQKEVQDAQKELSDMGESLSKQSKVLSKEAMQDKAKDLEQKRKKMEREFADKEEVLRSNIRDKQMALRERQLAVISEVSAKEGWPALIDKNTPGLLFVSKTTDQTPKLLKAVDTKYLASKKSVATEAKATAPKKLVKAA